MVHRYNAFTNPANSIVEAICAEHLFYTILVSARVRLCTFILGVPLKRAKERIVDTDFLLLGLDRDVFIIILCPLPYPSFLMRLLQLNFVFESTKAEWTE